MSPRVFTVATPDHIERLAAFLRGQVAAHPLQVAVEKWRARRSTSQNARLWALHQLAAEFTGYSADEMHELALIRHFGAEEIEVGGVTMRRPVRRSSARDTKEFAEFMEATEAWYATEFGVWLG